MSLIQSDSTRSNSIQSDEELKSLLINDNRIKVVQILKTYCPDCQGVASDYSLWSLNFKNCDFYTLDADAQKDLSKSIGFTEVPTFVFYLDGKEIEKISGVKREEILKILNSSIKSSN